MDVILIFRHTKIRIIPTMPVNTQECQDLQGCTTSTQIHISGEPLNAFELVG